MLHFFRKFQKYIFILVTIVIAISFSFFGTYSNMQERQGHDEVAFTAVDGSKIYRSELEQFVNFISTDAQDKLNFGGVWGPNFFNDGVLKKNFIETGMLLVLAEQFPEIVSKDLQDKIGKEKKFRLYTHPQANFLSTENVWKYFAPEMGSNFEKFISARNPFSREGLEARSKLFLNERQFPAAYLKYMLLMQEKQYNWIPHDSGIDYADFSLFGYHKIEDWFGQGLINIMSEFIINSAIIAKEKGYTVSKEETLADLTRNAAISFKQNEKSQYMNVSNVDQYMQEQLKNMNLDKNGAIKIWNQVLLFKRLFNEFGSSMFIDRMSLENFNKYTSQGIQGTLFQLPKEFRFSDIQSLAKFETYLDNVGIRPKSAKDRLDLPTQFKSAKEISKSTPELIQKRYVVDISEISKQQLQSKVTLKEMWNWQTNEENWKNLEKEFPELALSKATNSAERLDALEMLDDGTRTKVDKFSRQAIVNTHPEWISLALDRVPLQEMTLNIPLKGGNIYIKGNVNRNEFVALLDKASEDIDKDSPLYQYTADNENFYRIVVKEKSPDLEIMTYAEANKLGTLQDLVDAKLKNYYESTRDKHTELYQNTDKSWKNFTDVSDSVAGQYYGDLIKAIGDEYVSSMLPTDDNKNLSLSRAASLRFIKKASIDKSNLLTSNGKSENDDESKGLSDFDNRPSLASQWQLISSPYKTKRSSSDDILNKEEALSLNEGDWSKIYTPTNGDLYFFHAEKKLVFEEDNVTANKMLALNEKLGSDAECALCKKLIIDMKARNALNIAIANKKQPLEESPIEETHSNE